MANNDNKLTVFQRLNRVLGTDSTIPVDYTRVNPGLPISSDNADRILYQTTDKADYERKKLELRQNKFLAMRWKRAQYDIANQQYLNLSEVKLMYRDADLMDCFPEIGAALDVTVEESCYVSPDKGQLVNVYSKSDRVKKILEDLLANRLQIKMTLPMVCRSMLKYGNAFMLLNIDTENGVKGWKELPVYNMERYENMTSDNPYFSAFTIPNESQLEKATSTRFVWVGNSQFVPYRNWEMAHFRLLYDSIMLPYGCSFLNKARRHWRLLSQMEDAMLLYRLERSIERRVFKVNVAAIDEDDVPAYIEQFANEMKRTSIIDPATGQIDLRKNILGIQEDFYVPVRDDGAPSPIETLPAAQNLTAIDDIQFIQQKLFTALRVPKAMLNYVETAGEGKNLSLLDVRFQRTVNKIQQMLLLELNKVCIIHLSLLGFNDELTNFTLSMNNPSSQAEMLAIENLAKKITTAKDAITDNGNGIPLMSVTRALKEIMGWSDKEIAENLSEIRIEMALAAELQKTSQIIKRTGIFDNVDNIYGEPGAEYSAGAPGEEGEGGPGGGGGGAGAAMFGGDDMGGGDMPEEEDVSGSEGDMPMDQAANEAGAGEGAPDAGGDNAGHGPMNESIWKKGLAKVLADKKGLKELTEATIREYSEQLVKSVKDEPEPIPLTNKAFFINEDLDNMAKQLDKYIQAKKKEEKPGTQNLND